MPVADSSAAVVGANGFLGRALAAALESDGVRVSRFTRTHPCLSTGRPAPSLAGADTIFWAASSVNPAIAETDPGAVAGDHAAFVDVLDTLPPARRGRRVVLLSSGGTVYDPGAEPPYAETAPTRPHGAYGRAKLAMETALADAVVGVGERITLRLSNAYGPGQPAVRGQGVIAHWLDAARTGRALVMLGDPGTSRDYLFLADLTRALLAVHHHRGPLPAVLNVGSGTPTSLDELARTVLDVVADPDLRVRHDGRRTFDVSRTWLDVTAAADLLGWAATTSLRDGVAAAWAAAGDRQPTGGRR